MDISPLVLSSMRNQVHRHPGQVSNCSEHLPITRRLVRVEHHSTWTFVLLEEYFVFYSLSAAPCIRELSPAF